MKIDIHTHILPPEIPRFKEKYGYGGFIGLDYGTGCDHRTALTAKMVRDDGKFFREVERNCWDAPTRAKECEAYGVSHQVLSTVPVMFSYWAKAQDALDISKYINDDLASVVRNDPKHFSAIGNLPMQAPDLAIRELERCMKELKLSGVQIGSHIGDWNLSDPALFPVFEAASELGAAVFVHPWDMMGETKMQKYWLPWLVGMPAEVSLAICSVIFGGVLERLPNLRIAFAHGGGAFPGTIGRIEHGFDCRPDLVAVDNKKGPREYLGKFYVDSLVHDPEMLKYIVNLFGEDHVALGSDYPFPLGENEPGKMIEAHYDKKTQQKLLRENALRWLGKSL